MSHIEQLVKQYCPNGVEYKPLGELLDYEQPSKYIVKSTEYEEEGTPVLTAGQTFILGYTSETDGIYIADKQNPVIIFDDFTTSFHWVDFSFKVKSSAMKMLRPKNKSIVFKYIYYAMKVIDYTSNEHSRKWISIYSNLTIPVPPLPVQEEIVKILDAFTSLEAELEAELEARKKQYEYYRNQLLSFDENTTGGGRIKFMQLGDVCSIKGRIGFRGYTRDDLVEPHQGAISLSPANIVNNSMKYTNSTYVSWEKYNESPEIMIEKNDVVFCKTGSTIGKVSIIKELPEPATINPQLVVLKNIKCNPSYLSYILASSYFQGIVHKIKGVGSVPTLSQKDLANQLIPIPPLDEQERIVAILDKFDSLVNDISEGLPAEINARKQQYEHYRNKLLTFDEAA